MVLSLPFPLVFLARAVQYPARPVLGIESNAESRAITHLSFVYGPYGISGICTADFQVQFQSSKRFYHSTLLKVGLHYGDYRSKLGHFDAQKYFLCLKKP